MSKLSNYRTIALLAALFVIGALLKPVAASQQKSAKVEVANQYGSAAVTLYFVEATGQYLIPVSRRVANEAEQTPLAALEGLLAGPEAGPLQPLFEDGTDLVGFSTSAGQADVALVMPDMVRLPTQVVDALRWTLTEFEEIDDIALTVNGWSIDANGNFVDAVTLLDRPRLINSRLSSLGQPITLYFGYAPEPSLLVPMTVYIEAEGSDAQIAASIEQLLNGPPPGSNLVSTLPENVALLGSHMDGVIANVDFSEELVVAYRLKEANALHVRKAVIATLTSLPDVYAGSIEIGGSSLLYFTCQNAVMEHPQTKPWAINDEFYM